MPTYRRTLNAAFDLVLVANVVSQSTTLNRSALNLSLQLRKKNTTQSFRSTIQSATSITVGSSTVGGSSAYDFAASTTSIEIQRRDGVLVNHEADGSMTVTVGGSWAGGMHIPAGSISESFKLPTIPRVSQPTLSVAQVLAGGEVTIHTNRAHSSLRHIINYRYGNLAVPIANTSDTAASFTWQVPEAISGWSTTSTTVHGVVRVATYSGSDLLGTEDVSLIVTAPQTLRPTIDSVYATELNPAVPAGLGAFVQGISTIRIGMTGEAGVMGSTITARTMRFGDRPAVAGQTVDVAAPAAGSQTVTGQVTDSRGRTGTATTTAVVLPYSAPSATVAGIERVNSAGDPSNDGTNMRITIAAHLASLAPSSTEHNSGSVTISTRLRGATGWTQRTTYPVGAGTDSRATTIGGFPVTETHEVQVAVSDIFGSTSTVAVFSTAAVLMHWDEGAGVGIGKYRADGVLDVGGDTFVRGSLHSGGLDVAGDAHIDGTLHVQDLMVDGPLTTPLWWRGTRSAAQSLTANAWTSVVWAEDAVAGTWEVLSDRVYVPEHRMYRIGFQGTFAAANVKEARILLNGVTVRTKLATPTDNASFSMIDIALERELTAGTSVIIQVRSSGTSSLRSDTYSPFFDVTAVGPRLS